MNVLRKAIAKEAAELKPLLDMVYGAILRFQRQRTQENERRLRDAMQPAVKHLMVFRPYMPVYKQVFFDLLEALDRRREFPHIRAADGDYLVSGVAASPGRARGPARVLRDAGEVGTLRGGDILVCPMATPDWVAFFRRISGIITDEGGMLCHAAIVARELGLPCVTGCGDATERIQTGDDIELDGDLGLVTLPGTNLAGTSGAPNGRDNNNTSQE